MRRVQIDFAPRSLRRTLLRTPPRSAAFLFAVACLCLATVMIFSRYREDQAELEALQAALGARAQAARPLPVVATPRVMVSEAQARAVNDAVMQLNLPWRELHEAVRAATPDSVALLALEPDAKRRILRITAESRNAEDMLAYVARMQEQSWFGAVTLSRHEIVETDPNRPLRFQLVAQWGGQ